MHLGTEASITALINPQQLMHYTAPHYQTLAGLQCYNTFENKHQYMVNVLPEFDCDMSPCFNVQKALFFSYCLCCSTSFHPLSETRALSALIG